MSAGRSRGDLTSPADWPPMLIELAGVVGQKAAIAIAREFGGTESLYIPKPGSTLIKPGSRTIRLRELIGEELFQKLCREFPCMRLRIPRGARLFDSKKAQILANPDMPRSRLARRIGCSERYVTVVRTEHRRAAGAGE